MSTTLAPATALAGRYLTVQLAGEAYGIAVLKVREIIRLQKITPLPRLPDYIRGVLNLRGRVIPVLDLRLRFGLAAAMTERTCIVVVEVRNSLGLTRHTGLIVDAVEEVAHVAAEDIEPTPELGTRIDAGSLLGMARIQGTVKILLDIDRVVAPDDAASALQP